MVQIFKNKGIAFKLAFSILASCTIIFFVIFGYNYLFSREIIVKNIEGNANALTEGAVNKIETKLRPVEKGPEHIGLLLNKSAYGEPDIECFLKSMLESNEEIYGGTIAFAPYMYDKKVQYFAPYYYRKNGEIAYSDLADDSYKYYQWDWYKQAQKQGKPVWSEPYYDEGGGNILMATYSVPFYKTIDGKNEFAGVVTADISLPWLQEIISSIKIGHSGYGLLISRKGKIITHPKKELIMSSDIFALAKEAKSAKMHEIGTSMMKGEKGFVLFEEEGTKEKSWLSYTPLPSTKWSLCSFFPQKELMADVTKLNIIVLVLGAGGFLFLFIVIVSLSDKITGSLRNLAKRAKDIASGNLDFQVPPIRERDEVGVLSEAFSYMKEALKRYIEELTKTTAAKQKIESELKIAHDIQMGILPRVFPPFPEKTEFDIYAVLKPAKEVGGDLYDYFFIDEEHLCFVIGDVSGKGVPAALFMAMTKTYIRTLARTNSSVKKMFEIINRELAKENVSMMFVSIFCGVLNIKTGEIFYVNGGHNLPLIIQKGKEADFLQCTSSTIVGAFDEAVFNEEKLQLFPGDTMYLYTDGVTEAFNKDGGMFSEERLKDFVRLHKTQTIRDLSEGTLDSISSFSSGAAQSDDITVLVLRYFGPEGRKEEKTKSLTIIIRNDIAELEKLKKEITGFGKKNKVADSIIDDVNLAIEDAVSGIIFYGYSDDIGHQIKINITAENKEIIIEVEDSAIPFNPLEVYSSGDSQAPDQKKTGSEGIQSARALMDELEYRREEGHNILTMKKRIV